MLVSIVIKTKDEAPRLRLVLASLSVQSVPVVLPGRRLATSELAAEVIVVNDGSTDKTSGVLEEASQTMPLRVVHHGQCRGRSTAANAGARVAAGEVLLFLDGDTIASPKLVELHASRHMGASVVGRGETYHLRCTRFFLNPETGEPLPGQEDHVLRMGLAIAQNLVTREQVQHNFEQIERRAQPGLYPGAGPRRLYELEMDALIRHPQLRVLWMAASGQNLSMGRNDFEAVGGFDERLTINEHRELALRLQRRGVRLVPVPEARTYHLTHRSGWRDPLGDAAWKQVFNEAQACQEVKLMCDFWRGLGQENLVPERKIASLAQLEEILARQLCADQDSP